MKRFLYVLVIVICSVATTAYGQPFLENWPQKVGVRVSKLAPTSPLAFLKILEMESIKYFSILKAQPAKKP